MSKTIHLANLSKRAAKSLLTSSSLSLGSAKFNNKSLNTTASSNSIILNTSGAASSASIAAASKHLAGAQQRRNKAYYGTPQEFKDYQENLLLVNDETAIKWKNLPTNSNLTKTQPTDAQEED